MMHDYVLPSKKWVWLTHYVWLTDASQMQVELEFNFDFNYLNTGCVLQALHISWLVSWALVLLQLYLQMPHPGNVTQEEFNSAKEESHQAPASVFLPARLSSSVLSFWDFFFLKYIRTIFTYVKAMIWRTLLQGRDLPFPPGLAEAPAGELCGTVPALQSLDICDRSKEERLPWSFGTGKKTRNCLSAFAPPVTLLVDLDNRLGNWG